jgi:GYF domain 2
MSDLDQFHIQEGDKQRGPFTLQQMQNLWRSGDIHFQALYWQPGLEGWSPISDILDSLQPPKKRAIAPALQQQVLQAERNEFSNAVLVTFLVPFAGLIYGLNWLMIPEKRSDAWAIIGIACIWGIIWSMVLRVLLAALFLASR